MRAILPNDPDLPGGDQAIMRPRVITAVACAIIATALIGGCSAPKVIESAWPPAKSERVVPRPPGMTRWPLTGLPAPSEEAITSRVVSVKIENHSAARPQTGLAQADVIYEVIAEGGITRFHTLFQSQIPPVVGPVRSARPPDLYLIQQYHSILAHVGGSKAVMRILAANKSKYNDMDQFFNPAAYWRVSTRHAPHNMYLDIAKLRGFATSTRGYPASETITGLAFAPAARTASPTVTTINVPVSTINKVKWVFNAATGLYGRSINGKAHKDAVSGKQLTTRNLVVIWAKITPYPGDKKGVVEIRLVGTGKASVFVGGQRIDATWSAGTDAPPTFTAADGSVVKLDPGNTWIQVISTTTKITAS